MHRKSSPAIIKNSSNPQKYSHGMKYTRPDQKLQDKQQFRNSSEALQ